MFHRVQKNLEHLGMKWFRSIERALPKRTRWHVMRGLLSFLFLNGIVLFMCTVAFFITNNIPHVVFLIPYAIALLYIYLQLQFEVVVGAHLEATLEGYLSQQKRMGRVYTEKQGIRHEFKYGSAAEK
jgi:hypothetical protein